MLDIRYSDCRDRLYGRLTFAFHRVETAFDFLSARNRPILSEIKSLQLSVQLDKDKFPPCAPWHAGVEDWIELRNRLPVLSNITRLSIWMDAANPYLRRNFPVEHGLFDFDALLWPGMRLSIPVWDVDDGRYIPFFRARDYTVIGRGVPNWWQEPSIAPQITWYSGWGGVDVYDRQDDHPEFSGPHW